MKILLVGINSKFIHSNPAVYYLKEYAVQKAGTMAAGAGNPALLRTELEDALEIREYTINREPETTVADIFEAQPDVLAIACYIWNISYVRTVCDSLNKVLPHTDIWLGGPEVSYNPQEVFEKMPYVRGIIAGEGEQSFLEVCEGYLTGTQDSLPKVKICETLTLDDVPFPYPDLNVFDNRIVYYESSRGCPFACSYCLSSVDRKVRLRSLPLVYAELQHFLDAKIPLVKFVDRTFNCNREHTEGILQYIKAHDNGVTEFHFEIAAELLTDDQIELIASLRPGQIQLEIGVQTTNPDTLAAINRKSDTQHLKNIVGKLLKAQNCHIHLDLIAGLPFEDLASFRNSFNAVYAMHGHNLQLGFLKVLKGSPIENRTEEYGIVYRDEPPYEVLSTKWLSYADVLELKGVENVLEIYHNSLQFMNTLEFALPYFTDAYIFYLELAHFYKTKEYDKISLSRYERYSVLRDFLIEKICGKRYEPGTCEQKDADEAAITEVILHDLYLRDNVKSRPNYGEKGFPEKEYVHSFFESGAFREYIPEYEQYSPAQAARMTHIEKRRDGYYLYDYMRRDPISGNCKCLILHYNAACDGTD